jgi:hypothetical protein
MPEHIINCNNVPLIGAGRAFAGQDVRDPRLGFARPPQAVRYVGGRPDPSNNYAGGRRWHRVGNTIRYREDWNADRSLRNDTHDRVAALANGFDPNSAEYDDMARMAADLTRHWGVADHLKGSGYHDRLWSNAERRRRRQRLSRAQRLLVRVLKLRRDERLPWDTIADRLEILRVDTREKIVPKLAAMVGAAALALPREQARIGGRFVGSKLK